MAVDDSDIVRFIAKRTGFSTELVNRVVEAGEPWSPSIAIQQYFESRGKALDEALADPLETLQGLDRVEVDAEVVVRHQRYVAASVDVSEADVSSISEAMREFFHGQIQDIRRAKRRQKRRRR